MDNRGNYSSTKQVSPARRRRLARDVVKNYKPGYTWNKGGRLKELKIRYCCKWLYDAKQCSMLIITIDSLCVMLVKLDFGANMILLYLMSLGFFSFCRYVARKYLIMWRLKTFGRVLPSVARYGSSEYRLVIALLCPCLHWFATTMNWVSCVIKLPCTKVFRYLFYLSVINQINHHCTNVCYSSC